MPEPGAAPPRRVVLVGFMGSGKSSVGRVLAKLAGWSFVDLDALIEKRVGRSVAEIFRDDGERRFRREERAAARAVAARRRLVVAAGGGAFAEPATRRALQSGAATVYLECDIETLLERVPRDGSRPLAGSRATMRRLLRLREPSYRSADLRVDASRGTPASLAVMIARAFGILRRERAGGR